MKQSIILGIGSCSRNGGGSWLAAITARHHTGKLSTHYRIRIARATYGDIVMGLFELFKTTVTLSVFDVFLSFSDTSRNATCIGWFAPPVPRHPSQQQAQATGVGDTGAN
jgi:hypothetical protein